MRRDQGCLALVVVAPLVDGYKEEGVAGSVGNATARLLTQAGFSLPCCQVCCMKPALIAVLCIHTKRPRACVNPYILLVVTATDNVHLSSREAQTSQAMERGPGFLRNLK